MKDSYLVHKINVENYIPHRGSMILVDNLYKRSTKEIAFTSYIVRNSIFINKQNQLTTEGLIENMAQSHALKDGYFEKHINANFYIVGLENVCCSSLPQVGDVIYTQVENSISIGDMTIVRGWVKINDVLVIEGVLKLYKMILQ